jgi:hypothetical protein
MYTAEGRISRTFFLLIHPPEAGSQEKALPGLSREGWSVVDHRNGRYEH